MDGRFLSKTQSSSSSLVLVNQVSYTCSLESIRDLSSSMFLEYSDIVYTVLMLRQYHLFGND